MKSSLMAKTYHFFPQTLHKGSRNKIKIVSDQSLPHSKKLAASSQMACKFGKVNCKRLFIKLKANESHRPKLVKYEDPNCQTHIRRTKTFSLYNYKKQITKL